MKKLILLSATFLLAFTFMPSESKATTTITKTEQSNEPIPSKESLLNRKAEIKQMDKSGMSHSEKQALRKEVNKTNKALHDGYGGVYISVGALLLIILILILIF